MPIKPIPKKRKFLKVTKRVSDKKQLNILLDNYKEDIKPKKNIWDTSFNEDSFKFGPKMFEGFENISKDFERKK